MENGTKEVIVAEKSNEGNYELEMICGAFPLTRAFLITPNRNPAVHAK